MGKKVSPRNWKNLRNAYRSDASLSRALSGSNIVNKIREIVSYEPARVVFRILSENSQQLRNFAGKPSIINGLLSAGGICYSVYNALESYSGDYFDTWTEVYNGPLASMMFPYVVQHAVSAEIFTLSDKDKKIRRFEFENGMVFGCVMDNIDIFGSLFVDKGVSKADACEFLSELFWQSHGKSIVLTGINRHNRWGDTNRFLKALDDEFNDSLSSQMAKDHAVRLMSALKLGVNRAILYYGPPGTGKSTLCRNIIQNLGMTSLRIRYRDLADNEDLLHILRAIKTDAVIIDDIDRSNSELLLEILEILQRNVKLVLATANHKKEIDEACLRPGRFDELVYVKSLDADVAKSILGVEHMEVFETVKEWPVAFIQEYKKRCLYMSSEDAISSMEELGKRVARLSKYNDENDESLSSFEDGDSYEILTHQRTKKKRSKPKQIGKL